ncbi:MAG: aminotransferase class I/II-fold pyridoxal phosphate-dependent enzyme, partial [candidate division WOR-3 bacterium]
MTASAKITGLELHEFEYTLRDHGMDYNGLFPIFKRGSTLKRHAMAIRIRTDAGVTGEYIGGGGGAVGQIRVFGNYLIGKDIYEWERVYDDVKRALRFYDKVGFGPVDIARWDIVGKMANLPVYKLLGGYRTKLPVYASTYHGEHNTGTLDSPEAYADFAEQCLKMGYPAFKLHVWGEPPFERDAEACRAVGRRVGGKMDLMIDGSCAYRTFWDALKVARACDEANFMWVEDLFSDAGASAFAYAKLRTLIKTPILQMEMVRGVEPKIDFIAQKATDFVRGDPNLDCGFTGVMKIAHAAEGFGLDVELHGPGPAQRHLMAAIRKCHDYMVVAAPTPFQMGAVVAMGLPDSYYRDLREFYRERRDFLLKVFENLSVPVFRPDGAYYMMIRIDGLGYKDDEAFSMALVERAGLAVVPGSSFYHRPQDGREHRRNPGVASG